MRPCAATHRCHRQFLPTPSARRATRLRLKGQIDKSFLPTPSARRATDIKLPSIPVVRISTHALREEGDPVPAANSPAYRNFYPRPPRGGRLVPLYDEEDGALFLPTPSARRATYGLLYFGYVRRDFYPRPPRGGRRYMDGGRMPTTTFLPTPSARRATKTDDAFLVALQFLPTPSARRATSERVKNHHALCDFYPRPPRGGRRRMCWGLSIRGPLPSPPPPGGALPGFSFERKHQKLFLPTPSARRATGGYHNGQ